MFKKMHYKNKKMSEVAIGGGGGLKTLDKV